MHNFYKIKTSDSQSHPFFVQNIANFFPFLPVLATLGILPALLCYLSLICPASRRLPARRGALFLGWEKEGGWEVREERSWSRIVKVAAATGTMKWEKCSQHCIIFFNTKSTKRRKPQGWKPLTPCPHLIGEVSAVMGSLKCYRIIIIVHIHVCDQIWSVQSHPKFSKIQCTNIMYKPLHFQNSPQSN